MAGSNNAKMMEKTELVSKVKAEVQKSLLLEEADKEYWLASADNLPEILLESFYDFLKDKNDIVDKALEKALMADPEAVNELKNKIAKIKKLVLKLQEAGEDKPEILEKELEEQLKNL